MIAAAEVGLPQRYHLDFCGSMASLTPKKASTSQGEQREQAAKDCLNAVAGNGVISSLVSGRHGARKSF